MIFRKARMMERLSEEGREHMVDENCKAIMDSLDGQEVEKNRYKALVLDTEEYGVRLDGVFIPVNVADCE